MAASLAPCYDLPIVKASDWLIRTDGSGYTGDLASDCTFFETQTAERCGAMKWMGGADPIDVCCVCDGGTREQPRPPPPPAPPPAAPPAVPPFTPPASPPFNHRLLESCIDYSPSTQLSRSR